MDDTKLLGEALAEMLILGRWKIRFKILRKVKKDEGLTNKQIAYVLLLVIFVDICGILYGRDWVVKRIKSKEDANG